MRRLVALGLVVLLGPLACPALARDLVLSATGEAAIAQPMVVITLGDRPARPATKSSKSLEDLGTDLADLGDFPALAVLDTGASGHVLSQGTAERFGVTRETGSRYVEVGMSGDHTMAVSRAVTLEVADLEPEDDDAPRRSRQARAESVRLLAQRLLLNEAPTDLAAALLSPGSMVDVVGMPLIREHVIEIVPREGAMAALAVRLHASSAGLGVDTWIPLSLVDFNRRHPQNRGPLPSLATNPLVTDVRTTLGAADAAGDWLLDTGAACSMISTATARRLGLVDASGKPARRPDFTLPIGGIGGGHRSLPGFRLDRLTLESDTGRTLVFPDPAVVVHDISTVRADGTKVTLDGILGMNLLLPSGSGMTLLGAAEQLPAPFERVVIDIAHERLGLVLRR
jgi:hypothetical protein